MTRKPNGFFSRKSNEEILNYARRNHIGRSKSELLKLEGRFYRELKRRKLVDLLVEEGVLKEISRKGFYSIKSDEELLDYARKHHKGRIRSDVQKSESRLYDLLRRRGLLEQLLDEGTLEIRIKPMGFYSDQSDQELLAYTKENHRGKSKKELSESEGTLCIELRKRGLLESLVEEDTLRKVRAPNNLFKDKSDEELLDYARENHGGKSKTELSKSEEIFYNKLRKRNLLELLVEEGTLKTLRNPDGFFRNQSDGELLDFARKNHEGETRTGLSESESGLYEELRKRGLLESLVEEGVLEKTSRPKGFHSSKSDEELLDYARENHSGETKTDLQKSNSTLSNELRKRGLLESLVEDGTLKFKSKPNGFYSNKSDEKLLDYAREHHKGNGKVEVYRSEGSLYGELLRRDLLEQLVEEGTLKTLRIPNGFFRNQSDGELLDFARKNHEGETRTELSKSASGLYGELRKRGLLESLVEEGVLEKTSRPKGFHSSKSDEELLDYARKNHKGKSKWELSKSEGTFYDELRKRSLLEVLVDEGTFKDGNKRGGQYSDSSNEELLDYAREHHKGKTKTELSRSKGNLHKELRERNLLEILIDEGTLKSLRIPNGFYSNQSDEELLDYVREHHKGKSKGELSESESGLCIELRKRGLLESLAEAGTLSIKLKPRGFYSDQSDEELLDYTRKHHSGETKTELHKSEGVLHKELRERNLLEILIDEGTLKSLRIPNGFYSNQSDEELLDYVREHHKGKSKGELSESESGLCIELKKRSLLESLVEEGVLEKTSRPKGFYSNRSNKELLDYARENHSSKSRVELSKSESSLYSELRKRDLLDLLVEDGTLIRLRSPQMDSQGFIRFLQQDQTARNLATAATTMNGEGYEFIKILEEVYGDKFKDVKQIHQLLQESEAEIRELLREGMTNLGSYIGGYELDERRVAPLLVGQTITSIPEELVTSNLEDRLIRILQREYSPRFSQDQVATMTEIREVRNSSEGKKRELYQRLYDHYEDVAKLGEELN